MAAPYFATNKLDLSYMWENCSFWQPFTYT